MKLKSDETVLTGEWLFHDGQMHSDITCARIEWLINHHLQKIQNSSQYGAWEVLYRNPDDGEYWERTYPHSERHGGGPPQLQRLPLETVKRKYSI